MDEYPPVDQYPKEAGILGARLGRRSRNTPSNIEIRAVSESVSSFSMSKYHQRKR